MRLALLTVALALTACGSSEARLEAAVASLKTQLADRQRLLAEADDLKRFGEELDEWRAAAGPVELPLVPQPRVPLTPYKLSPLAPPELPPAVALESSRAKELRAEAASLMDSIRRADAALSEQELRKKDLALRLASALEVDRQKREAKEARMQVIPPFAEAQILVDAGIIAPPPKEKMRRLEP